MSEDDARFAAMDAPRQQGNERGPPRAVEDGGRTPREKRAFHRGEALNFHPRAEDFATDTFLDEHLLKGWVPDKPVLSRGMRITAFGSCFAANITRHLSAIGFDVSGDRDPEVYISRLGDAMVNTQAILGQFQWALENKTPDEALWHGFDAQAYGCDEDIRLRTRAVLLATEFFIVTLGLSEVWYDTVTGGTFWRAVPEDAFDPARHKFRVQSFAQTKSDIEEIHRLIRTHVPNAKVLFTLSPIPLAATFRPVSCLTANAASKAIIRAALDEFMREHESELNQSLFYFPSMELVTRGFIDPWGEDERHPQSYVIDAVMKVFEASFCEGGITKAEAVSTFQMFRARNLRAIARRRGHGQGDNEVVKQGRKAEREGRRQRREAKAHQVRLNQGPPAPDDLH
jgi:GSCFA family